MFKSIGRFAVTIVLVVLAGIVVWNIWIYYELAPRTRDGRISADVVTIAADVAGHVVDIAVKNDEPVKKGDALFQLDPTRYKIALRQAEASAAQVKATLIQARHDLERYDKLGNVASVQQREQAATAVAEAQANDQQAQAALDLARLNLERTAVKSPVNGIVTNLALQAGDYVSAGTPVMAIVDSDSFYAVGYFEETKLSKIKVGDQARVTIMGENGTLTGHVSGISAAVTDPDRTTNAELLPNVNPSFAWVRLAQRIPVRIALDKVPASLRLVAGRTASVDIVSDPSISPQGILSRSQYQLNP
jgi:RND family efflux transporter MFP subunit